jgi:TetR/AcrR family transcriptional regulator, cholesterol catabolism regulator
MARSKLTKRKIQGSQTRQKIFETSLELFHRHGYDNVTIDDICEKIGVSKGAFYTHFKSKDQVILENFIYLNSFYDDIISEIPARKNSLEKMFLFQQKIMKNIAAIGFEAVKLVYHLETSRQKKKSFLISKNISLYRIITVLVKEGQKNGEIRKDKSADAIASMLVQIYRGIILDWCLDNGAHDLVESINGTMPFIYEAIRSPRK